MSTILSALGEATGMKPSDEVIATIAVMGEKMKASTYFMAYMATVSPDLRHLFSTHMQDCMSSYERVTDLIVRRGWFHAFSSPPELVQDALICAKPVLS